VVVADEPSKPNYGLWFGRGLATLSAAWCAVAGYWIWVTPVAWPRYTGNPSTVQTVYLPFGDTSPSGAAPLLLPVAVGVLGAWAAWRDHRFVLGGVAALLLLFSFVVAFPYMPAGAGMAWATAALLSVERSPTNA
jgi:hypothetical protein